MGVPEVEEFECVSRQSCGARAHAHPLAPAHNGRATPSPFECKSENKEPREGISPWPAEDLLKGSLGRVDNLAQILRKRFQIRQKTLASRARATPKGTAS